MSTVRAVRLDLSQNRIRRKTKPRTQNETVTQQSQQEPIRVLLERLRTIPASVKVCIDFSNGAFGPLSTNNSTCAVQGKLSIKHWNETVVPNNNNPCCSQSTRTCDASYVLEPRSHTVCSRTTSRTHDCHHLSSTFRIERSYVWTLWGWAIVGRNVQLPSMVKAFRSYIVSKLIFGPCSATRRTSMLPEGLQD